MNNLLKLKNFYLLITAFSISILIGAIYIEYIVGAKPCVLCKYQRIPYLVSIFICFFDHILLSIFTSLNLSPKLDDTGMVNQNRP